MSGAVMADDRITRTGVANEPATPSGFGVPTGTANAHWS
jgi:hypothetical protein